jgi:hypothetical protein
MEKHSSLLLGLVSARSPAILVWKSSTPFPRHLHLANRNTAQIPNPMMAALPGTQIVLLTERPFPTGQIVVNTKKAFSSAFQTLVKDFMHSIVACLSGEYVECCLPLSR